MFHHHPGFRGPPGFIAAVTAACCSQNKNKIFYSTLQVMAKVGHIAWMTLFEYEPTNGGAVSFRGPFNGDIWYAAVKDTPLASWQFDWKQVERSPELFDTFMEVSASLREQHIRHVSRAWLFAALQVGGLAVISLHGMTAEKYARIVEELSAVLPPDILFPSVSEIRDLGPLIRLFLVKEMCHIGHFFAEPASILRPNVTHFTANTYARAVLGGLTSLTLIIDTVRQFPYQKLWSYMIENYREEFENIMEGLRTVTSCPYVGYMNTEHRANLTQAKMAMWFAVARLVSIRIMRNKPLERLRWKEKLVSAAKVEEIVATARADYAAEISAEIWLAMSLSEKPVGDRSEKLDKTPQEVVDAVAEMHVLLARYESEVYVRLR